MTPASSPDGMKGTGVPERSRATRDADPRHTAVEVQLASDPPGDAALGPRRSVRRGVGAREREDLVLRAFDEHQHELMSFSYGITRDVGAAEDLVQETFLRLVAELGKGPAPENLRAWLYRVCGNLAVSRARRRAVADRLAHLLPIGQNAPSPELGTLRDEQTATLHQALMRIAPDGRTALVLAANGFSGREIARALGRSETATRTLMFRARERLRDQLGHEEHER
jgi:RNA polymerase sigma-70 factor (ECF subfamily)